jgi:hypothetical protein
LVRRIQSIRLQKQERMILGNVDDKMDSALNTAFCDWEGYVIKAEKIDEVQQRAGLQQLESNIEFAPH